MKKIVSPLSNGGAPIYNTDLTTMQDNIYEAFSAHIKGLFTDVNGTITTNQACVLTGCVVTSAMGIYAISAGIVFIDGEIMEFAGASGLSAPISTSCIIAGTPTVLSRSFENATSHPFSSELKAVYSTTLPGSGSYVKVSTAACSPLLNNITGAALKVIQQPSLSSDNTAATVLSPSGSTIPLLIRNWCVMGNRVVLNFEMAVSAGAADFFSAIITLPINGIAFAKEFSMAIYDQPGAVYLPMKISRDESNANQIEVTSLANVTGTFTIYGQIVYSTN